MDLNRLVKDPDRWLKRLDERLSDPSTGIAEVVTAQSESMALLQLTQAGGSMGLEAFRESWQVFAIPMLNHLVHRGWATCDDTSVGLTEAGRAARQ